MAACLMFCGVGKSGSPAPKSTTSLPSRRRRSASAATFMVDDALISEILSASAWVVGIALVSLLLILLRDAAAQALFNQRRHQRGDVASERRHFLHQLRTDEGIRFGRHQEHGFNAGAEKPVHVCDLQ